MVCIYFHRRCYVLTYLYVLSIGGIAACRCLTRIAATIACVAQSLIKESLQTQPTLGIVDLLMHAASHKSVHMSGIALKTLPHIMSTGSSINTNILNVLQQRASWSECQSDALTPQISKCIIEEFGVDFDEFESFRENILTAALVSCYLLDRHLYLKSCADTITQVCQTHTKRNWRQLEAALFCINAVAIEACKHANFFDQSSDIESNSAQNTSLFDANRLMDSRAHNELLSSCINTLSGSLDICVCNPLLLAQMCRFIGKVSFE